MKTRKITVFLSILTVMALLTCCSAIRTPITITNNSQAEYDIIPMNVRLFFSAAEKYDFDDYSASISSAYIVSDTKPKPVTLKWSYGENDGVLRARVYLSQSESFENAEIFEVSESSLELENVYTGATYYWYVEAENQSGTDKSEIFSFNVKSGVRLIAIDGVKNCRDMGGWQTLDGKTVKEGLAYRTARLSGATDSKILITEKGIDTAINKLKIKTELDLRGKSEMRNEAVPEYGELGEQVNYVNIPASSYAYFFTSSAAKDELMLFADFENYPILFHCAGGIDRTGTLSFIIKALLGVSEKDLVIDHELSYGRYRNDREYSYENMIYAFKKLKGDTFSEKAYNCMKKNFGLSEMAISNIKSIFLSDGAVFEGDSLKAQKLDNGKATYKLNMRSSESISSVTIEGAPAEYTLDNGVLTVFATEQAKTGKHTGSITFNDGATLNFEYK